MTTPPPPPPPAAPQPPSGSMVPPPPPGAGASPPASATPPPGPAAPPPPPVGPPTEFAFPIEPAKQPRPRAKVGGAILLVGIALVLVGCFLPWVTGTSTGDVNGFGYYYCTEDGFECLASDEDVSFFAAAGDSVTTLEMPAVIAVIGVVILFAFAIVLLAAGRVLPIAIIGVILSAIGLFFAGVFLAVAYGATRLDQEFDSPSMGVGVLLQFVGALTTLAAFIVTLVMRRRPAAIS